MVVFLLIKLEVELGESRAAAKESLGGLLKAAEGGASLCLSLLGSRHAVNKLLDQALDHWDSAGELPGQVGISL